MKKEIERIIVGRTVYIRYFDGSTRVARVTNVVVPHG